jgi:carbamoyltransferase
LGPCYSDADIERFLREKNVAGKKLDRAELIRAVAALLAQEKVVGWFQGRMEFGPRALGARSILGDPRSPGMQSTMNMKIKFRESFRPFAPSVLREKASDLFELDCESPYMLLVAPVRADVRIPVTEEGQQFFGVDRLKIPRSRIPAVTHVDYSARVQTVRREDNPLYYDLIAEFDRLTGCPALINTSFNVRGEPIVCSPTDAYKCFMRTNMDYLVMGSFVLSKDEQGAFADDPAWAEEYQLD